MPQTATHPFQLVIDSRYLINIVSEDDIPSERFAQVHAAKPAIEQLGSVPGFTFDEGWWEIDPRITDHEAQSVIEALCLATKGQPVIVIWTVPTCVVLLTDEETFRKLQPLAVDLKFKITTVRQGGVWSCMTPDDGDVVKLSHDLMACVELDSDLILTRVWKWIKRWLLGFGDE